MAHTFAAISMRINTARVHLYIQHAWRTVAIIEHGFDGAKRVRCALTRVGMPPHALDARSRDDTARTRSEPDASWRASCTLLGAGAAGTFISAASRRLRFRAGTSTAGAEQRSDGSFVPRRSLGSRASALTRSAR